MNTENEKRLDDLFKKKLEDPVDQIRYEEGDWDALEGMLDESRKRRSVVLLWPILSGVAAMLLIALGIWLFKPDTPRQPGNNVAGHNHKDTTNNNSKIAKANDAIIDKSNLTAGVKDTVLNKNASIAAARTGTILDATQNVVHATQARNKISNRRFVLNKKVPVVDDNVAQQQSIPSKKDDQPAYAQQPVINKKDTGSDKTIIPDKVSGDTYAINQQAAVAPAQKQASPDVTSSPSVNNTGLAANTPGKSAKVKPQLAYRPQYTLSIVAAPDLNGVSSFAQSKVGTNIGLTFALGVSRKLTVSTGALYSVKPYLTSFANYNSGSSYKWPVNPQSVTADCRMLDIPLNIGYLVYHKQQNKISVGTGLSSYIMLHESYKFTYNNQYGGASGPGNYTVPNPGKYFFGIMNLNATYERQLNSKVGISIQPYLKVPLSNVGYSQVKLQTTGVAVGLSWNLNSLKTP
ncbi:MAG: hypothetical protein ACTHMI_17835 [Mucilaginibacter sp.]